MFVKVYDQNSSYRPMLINTDAISTIDLDENGGGNYHIYLAPGNILVDKVDLQKILNAIDIAR